MERTDITLQGKHAHIANMLLKQLRIKEITMDEFLMQCAYWGVKTIGDMYYRSLPSRPMEVVSYEGLSYSKRNRLTKEYYEDHPGVSHYYEDKERITRINRESLWKLRTYKKFIPESDTVTHEKLDKVILDFKIKMED